MNEHNEQTTGQIARRLGAPRYRIEYIIESRGIEPVRRVGITRLFNRDSQALIEAALKDIKAWHKVRETNEPVAAVT